jgi:SAM-dependent methyltransferase
VNDAIRPAYDALGPDEFYLRNGAAYRNPHEKAIVAALGLAVVRWSLDVSNVLDLACGSGEVTLALDALGAAHIDGIDPYTAAAYLERTGRTVEPTSFEAIAAGALCGRTWSLVVCSYALHLMAESRLPLLARRLADVTGDLVIVSPHKRPALKPGWGWALADEFTHDRVRVRRYTANP